MGYGAVLAGSMLAGVLAIFLSVMAANFGPSPGAMPAAAACVMVSLVGSAAGNTLKKLEDRVKALEARREPPAAS